MTRNLAVSQHSIDAAKCQAWISRIEAVQTGRDALKEELLRHLRAGDLAAFEARRQTLIGDNHGQGRTWKPSFVGFWDFINRWFSWLTPKHEPGSPLYRELLAAPPAVSARQLPPPQRPDSIGALLGRPRDFTPADFHTLLKSFAQREPAAFLSQFTTEGNRLYLEQSDYGFLCMDVLTECLLGQVLPAGNDLSHKADALQELLLVLANNPTEIPHSPNDRAHKADAVRTALGAASTSTSATTDNRALLHQRLGKTTIHHPLLEHVARRGVERLLLQLPITDEEKNIALHPLSPFRTTIDFLCKTILGIIEPKFEEGKFAGLTQSIVANTHFGDYRLASHSAFALSLAFARKGAEGALWTFMDDVNRGIIDTDEKRAYVLKRFVEVAALERFPGTFDIVKRFIMNHPLIPMTGTPDAVKNQINERIQEALASRIASASSSVDDNHSVSVVHQCGAFSPGGAQRLQTTPQSAQTPEDPETQAPETGCP